jgi:hypothetical protein
MTKNLLAGLGAGEHELCSLQEVAERRARVGRDGAPDGAEGTVGDGGLRREGGREAPDVGCEVF